MGLIFGGVGLVVIIGAALIFGVALLGSFKSSMRKGDMPSIREISDLVKEVQSVDRTVEPKSVSGATSIYLPMVVKDFPDFHNEEAIAAVKTLLCEYLAIRYEGAQDFMKSQVSEGLLSTVDKGKGHEVKDETVHKVAMSKYVKTKEYATITYQAAVGYKLDGEPVEERYAVEYTLKLIENGYTAQTLICPRCGGSFDSTKDTRCPYCGGAIVRDTWFSWLFTAISET